MTIATLERETYERAWATPGYADFSPGETYADVFASLAPAPATVIDAGCGAGKGALALEQRGYTVTLVDVTDTGLTAEARALPFWQACLWHRLHLKADYAYCCDVLEHVPPTLALLTAARVCEAARKGTFFSIALEPDRFGALIGKPLHQTVQSFVDWRDQLREVGTVSEARDLGAVGLYWVTP